MPGRPIDITRPLTRAELDEFTSVCKMLCRGDVEQDLEERPDLAAQLGSKTSRFIRWAGGRRFSYKADIDEEARQFLERHKDRRISALDSAAYYALRSRIFQRDNHTCQYCGATNTPLEMDHRHPICRGGSESDDNLTTACARCNRQKHDKTPEEFAAWKAARNG